jgi:Asp-tRNA(Asn)/Glu-tRNA(Gln) amidotransferase A subunit family amidase
MHLSRLLNLFLVSLVFGAFSSGLRAVVTPPVAVEEATISALHAAYRGRSTTVTAVVQAHLDRIAAYDQQGPVLNSIVNVHPAALAHAAELDHALAEAPVGELPAGAGPLWGVPVVVKDNLDAVGVPMTNGFQGWKNYVPPSDSPVVARIKAAGGVLLAKTSLSEFARGGGDNINSVLPGFARNPYHPLYATGGSSGGTGAALAASFAVVGIGTDTGGSVRMPAAHNALAGLRPTVGLVSRTGVVPLDGHRDTAGPMARTVTDMAILLDAIAWPDPADPATATPPHREAAPSPFPSGFAAALDKNALKGVRLGVLRQVFKPERTAPEILANFEKTLAELRASGAEIIDPFIVPELDSFPRAPQTPASFKADYERWASAHPGVPFPTAKTLADSRLLHPLHQQATEQAAAALPAAEDPRTVEGRALEQRYREAFIAAMDAARIDALVFPTWAQPPARNGDRNTQITGEPAPVRADAAGSGPPTRLGASLTFVASTLQWPGLSVPNGFTREGLPLGLQLVGRPWSDARLVAYGYAYEQATLYRRPPAHTPPLASADPAARFIGTWKLVAIRDRDPATGVETPAARAAADGQLLYAPNGRMSVQIIRTGREGGVPTADGFSSYFGRWTLLTEEGCMVHHQDGQLNPAQTGVAAKRYYSFDAEGRLSLATPPRVREGSTTPLQSVFVWERYE